MLKITKVKPMFTDLIITADRFENDILDKGIVLANKGDLKPYQTVIAIGNAVRDINVGDKVMVDFEIFAEHKIPVGSVKKNMDVDDPVVRYNIPWVTMTDEQTLRRISGFPTMLCNMYLKVKRLKMMFLKSLKSKSQRYF